MTKEDMLMSLASTLDEDYIVQSFLEMKLKSLDKTTTLRDLFLNSSNEGWGTYLGNMTLENFIRSSMSTHTRSFTGSKQVADKSSSGTRQRTSQAEIRELRSCIEQAVNANNGISITDVLNLIQYSNRPLVRRILKSLIEENKISHSGKHSSYVYCPK